MNLIELIEEDKFNFTNNNTISELIIASSSTNSSHFPIFDNKIFLGMVSKKNLDSSNGYSKISDQKKIVESFFIFENQSILDAIKFFEVNKTNILPVLDSKYNFLGVLKQKKVFNQFSKNYLFSEYGETIIIEIEEKNFSMKEVSNIIEYNNGKIIGIFITNIENNNIQLCVKFTSTSLNSVGETFERYNYRIVNKFFNDYKQEIMSERYNYLLNFIKK